MTMVGRCCLCNPVLDSAIYRWARFEGPQATESLGENTAWTNTDFDFSRLSNWGYNGSFEPKPGGVPENGYCVTWDPTSTPTGTNGAGNSYWELKLHPMRIKADSFGEAYHGKWSQTPRQFGDPAGSYRWFPDQFKYLFPTAPSSTTLGSNSHLWPMTMRGIRWPMGLFWQPGYSIYLDSWYDYLLTVEVTHYRVLIGGSDVTGIRSLSPTTQGSAFGWKIGEEANFSNAQDIGHGTADPVRVASSQYNEQTVAVDYWLKLTLTENPFPGAPGLPGTGELPSDPGAEPVNGNPWQILWCEYANFGQPIELYQANYTQNINASTTYRVTFADNGPDGVSTVDIATGSGWTLEEYDTHDVVRKPVTGGRHEIFFVYGVEIPVITLQIYDATYPASSNDVQCVYWPQDSLDYDAMYTEPGLSFTPGVWSPTTSTTFVPVAIVVGGNVYWNGSMAFPTSDSEYIPRFPSSLTLGPV
jgi:hypothetical protein